MFISVGVLLFLAAVGALVVILFMGDKVQSPSQDFCNAEPTWVENGSVKTAKILKQGEMEVSATRIGI